MCGGVRGKVDVPQDPHSKLFKAAHQQMKQIYPMVLYQLAMEMAQSKFREFSLENSMVDLSSSLCERLPECTCSSAESR